MGGEEDMGKRVDMNAMFQQYVNLKKVSVERKHKFRDATYARLKRKRAELEVDDPLVDETMEEEYSELDYIEWLKTFDQFHDIPRFCKYREKNYTDYLEKIIEYLRGLLVRAQPMVGVAKLEQQFEKEFEERYADRSIPGWQESTHKEKLFCLPTSKLLKSEATRKSHMTGQLYKKRMGESQGSRVMLRSGTISSATRSKRLYSTCRRSRVRRLRRWRQRRMMTRTTASMWMTAVWTSIQTRCRMTRIDQSTTRSICPWVGMASLFPSGSTSCTGWASSTSARSVATTRTGVDEHSSAISRSGDTHSACGASGFRTPRISRRSQRSRTRSHFTRSWRRTRRNRRSGQTRMWNARTSRAT